MVPRIDLSDVRLTLTAIAAANRLAMVRFRTLVVLLRAILTTKDLKK